MALKSIINLDLIENSSVLVILDSTDNPVENITFADGQITFDARSDINITAVELVSLIEQFNLFQTSILSNFAVNLGVFPFGDADVNENHDLGTNAVALVAHYNGIPRAVSYLATGDDGMVLLNARSSSKTIEFPEWIHLLYNLNHYKASVKALNGI